MTDWRVVAKALEPAIPETDIERVVPILEQLERVWEPLRASIPPGTEMWTPE
jgi:hypothetical protein